MGFENVKDNDLVGDSLNRLLEELQKRVDNKDFDSIKAFAEAFAEMVEKKTFYVNEAGERQINVSEGEMANIQEATNKMMEIIKKLSDTTYTPEELEKRAEMMEAVNIQLGGIFKQGLLMQELIERGFSPEDFIAQAGKSNELSDKKLVTLKEEKTKTDKLYKDIFGKDVDIGGKFSKKSLPKDIEDHNLAKHRLLEIKRELQEIINYEEAIKNIMADTTIEDEDKDKMIAANKGAITTLENNIKGQINYIERLNITTLDISKIKNCENKDAIDRTDAIAEIDGLVPVIDGQIDELYTREKNNIIANRNRTELTDEDIDLISKIDDSSATPEEKAKAKEVMDKFAKDMSDKREAIDYAIKQEKILKTVRDKGAADYKERYDRVKDFESKLSTVEKTRQKLDTDGNPMVDADGNPVMETYMAKVPSRELITEYLKDFDEDSVRTRLETDEKERARREQEAFKSLSRKERRDEFKRQGIGNWFTRRFMQEGLAQRVPQLTAGSIDSKLQAEKNRHIGTKLEVDKNKFIEDSNVIMTARDFTEASRRRAAVQSKMQDAAYDVARHNEDKSEVVDAMDEASYEEALYRYVTGGVLTPAEKARFDKVRKNYHLDEVVKKHAEKPGVAQADNKDTPIHEDR